MDTTETEKFEYNYSAKKQEEIERIKSKYVSHQDTVLDKMRALDRQTERKAAKQPIIIGSIGSVLLAIGMCATLVPALQTWFIIGVIIGIAGIVMMTLAFPLYTNRIRKEREEVSEQMLELARQAEE